MKDDVCDVVLVVLAITIACVGFAWIISRAVSTAVPESAMKASSMLHPHRMAADAPDEMRNEKPTLENRIDR